MALQATRSDGATEPLTWGLVGGTKSDSLSADGTLQVSGPADRTLTVTVSDASGAAGRTTVTVGAGFDRPAGVTAVQQAGGAGADVSWTAPAATGGSPLAGYTILTDPSTGTHTAGAGATSLKLPALTPGSYAVSVYARNTRGQTSPPGTALLTIDGAALTFDHSQSVDVPAPGPISCPTTSFCLSVGSDTVIDRSGRWTSRPGLPGVLAPSLSCVSPVFCAVVFQVDGGSGGSGSKASIFNGTRWSAPVTIDTGSLGLVSSLSCASARFCVAADYEGRVIRYTGSGWDKPKSLLPASSATSVSCSSASTCVATSGDEWARYQGGAWSAAKAMGRNITVTAVSCASASYCVGIGWANSTNAGSSTTFNGSTWSALAGVTSFGGVSGDSGARAEPADHLLPEREVLPGHRLERPRPPVQRHQLARGRAVVAARLTSRTSSCPAPPQAGARSPETRATSPWRQRGPRRGCRAGDLGASIDAVCVRVADLLRSDRVGGI